MKGSSGLIVLEDIGKLLPSVSDTVIEGYNRISKIIRKGAINPLKNNDN